MADMYAPCPCGSGRKFKFCCFEKGRALDREPTGALLRRAREFPVRECWVNPEWRQQGMATVGIVREMPNLKYLMGVYLVDVFCLGLKDSFCQVNIKANRIAEFKGRYPQRFESISYEDARSLILGAIEYARGLGFEPHRDSPDSQHLVEPERPFNHFFEFGHEGKPFYIQGPNDDAAAIMDRLRGRLQAGEADFLQVLDEHGLAGFGRDPELERRREAIAADLEAKRGQQALVKARELLARYPELSEAHFLMGTALGLTGDYNGSISHLERAVELEPQPEMLYNLGGSYVKTLRLRKAVECYRRAIDLESGQGEVSTLARKELKSLEDMARQHSHMSLDDYLAQEDRFNTAFDHLSHGRAEEAIGGFQRVLEIDPRHVQSHGNLGLAYAMRGDRERALEHLDRALELDPTYEPAVGNRARIQALAPGERLSPARFRSVEYYRERFEEEHGASSSAGSGAHDVPGSTAEEVAHASLRDRMKRWFTRRAG